MQSLRARGDAGRQSDGPGAAAVARGQWWNPSQLATLLVVPLYVLARQHGWIAHAPLWVLVGSLVVAQLGTTGVSALWPTPKNGGQLWARIGVMQVGVALCIYVTGWGATLALGFVFGAAETIRVVGSRVAKPAAIFTVSSILLGEIHGLAMLEAVGAAMIIALLGWATAEKERVEESVRRSEERFRALVQHGSDVIMVIDLEGGVRYVSPSIARALGYDADTITQLTGDFIDEADLMRARTFLGSIASGQHGEAAWMELRLRHANGSLRWFEVGVTNRLEDPSVAGMVCNMRDVTERKGIEAELAHRAHHDPLTSLPNRASFIAHLEAALEDSKASGATIAVLFLDVDRFKLVNDSLGRRVARADRVRRPRDRAVGQRRHRALHERCARSRRSAAPRRPGDVRREGQGPLALGAVRLARGTAHGRAARARGRPVARARQRRALRARPKRS